MCIMGDGPLDTNANRIIVNNRSILSSMCGGFLIPGQSSRSDLKNIFYFASDTYSSQEWGLYYNGDSYELVTDGNQSTVASSLENVSWKIHSHPDVPANTKAEFESLGFWLPSSSYDDHGNLINSDSYPEEMYGDWSNYVHAVDASKGEYLTSLVYFPVSRNVYSIQYTRAPQKVRR